MAFFEEVETLFEAPLRRFRLEGASSRRLVLRVPFPVVDEGFELPGKEELKAGANFAPSQEDLGHVRIPAYRRPEEFAFL